MDVVVPMVFNVQEKFGKLRWWSKETLVTKRRRRRPQQIVKLLQEGEAMLSAGKTLGEDLLPLAGH